MARDAERPSAGPLRRLFALSVDMLGTASADGYFSELNPAWERSLGWTREELMAEPYVSFVHPDDVEATLREAARLLAGPGSSEVVALENRYRTRAGDYRWVRSTTVAEAGVLYFVARDVTDLRAAEIERDQAAGVARAVAHSVADGLYVIDGGGSIVYVNRSGRRMLGYAAGELNGRDGHAALHHSRPDGTPFPVEDCPLAAGRSMVTACQSDEDGFWRKDGSLLPVAYSSTPVPLAAGAGSVVVFRDISAQRAAAAAQREAEQLIRSSEALHRALTANLPDTSVFLVDRDLLILVAEGEAIGRLAWSGEEMFRGRKLNELNAEVPGEVLDLWLDSCRAALRGERRACEFESEGLTFAVHAAPVCALDGTVESALLVAGDITERTRAARELNQARRLESVGRLAGGIAHDFNNLLGVIVNYADFVAEELGEDSPALEDVGEITRAAERAAALTRQLLTLSRRDVVKPEIVDLSELASGLESLLRRALGERVRLDVVCAAGLWPIEADRGQLEQVLVNLAVNGRDAMPSGGRLVVETSNAVLEEAFAGGRSGIPAGDYVRLTVSDSGVGMTPEAVERAFEPFFTTKPAGEGTGLGLATVYGIVTEAGGHVTLYSEAGIGTSVKIHLPVCAAPAGRSAATADHAPIGRGETLLVVDDEPEVRRMSARILTRAGYSVITAAGGQEALELLASSDVDLLVTDVIMPGMTGPELVERVRASRPAVKVIFMSGYSHKVLGHEALGGDTPATYLEKPFGATDLQLTVRAMLDAHTDRG